MIAPSAAELLHTAPTMPIVRMPRESPLAIFVSWSRMMASTSGGATMVSDSSSCCVDSIREEASHRKQEQQCWEQGKEEVVGELCGQPQTVVVVGGLEAALENLGPRQGDPQQRRHAVADLQGKLH